MAKYIWSSALHCVVKILWRKKPDSDELHVHAKHNETNSFFPQMATKWVDLRKNILHLNNKYVPERLLLNLSKYHLLNNWKQEQKRKLPYQI